MITNGVELGRTRALSRCAVLYSIGITCDVSGVFRPPFAWLAETAPSDWSFGIANTIVVR